MVRYPFAFPRIWENSSPPGTNSIKKYKLTASWKVVYLNNIHHEREREREKERYIQFNNERVVDVCQNFLLVVNMAALLESRDALLVDYFQGKEVLGGSLLAKLYNSIGAGTYLGVLRI